MAEILKTYEPVKRQGPQSKYPYDKWLDKKIRRLKRGEDFQCTRDSIAGLIRDAAKARGLSVHVWMEDEDTVVVQAGPPIPRSMKT